MREKGAALSCVSGAMAVLFLMSPVAAFPAGLAGGEATSSLQDLLDRARQSHPRLAGERQKVVEREYELKSVSHLDLPSLDGTASYYRLAYVTPIKQRFLGASPNDYQGRLTLKQPLWSGGGISAQERSAVFGLDAAREGYRLAERDVLAGVKAAYVLAFQAQESHRIKEELTLRVKRFLDVSEDLHRRTRLPRLEALLRLRVQHQNAVQDEIAATHQMSVSRIALLQAMGASPSDSQILPEKLHEPAELDHEPRSEVPADRHPAVQLRRKEIAGAAESVHLARSRFQPQIYGTAGYGYEWAEFGSGRSDWTAGVVLEWPLWDWGRRRALVRQASARKSQLEQSERLTGIELSSQWETATARRRSAVGRLELARTNVDMAEKSLRLYEERYRDGVASNLEWLDAQQAWVGARLNYLQAQTDGRLAAVEMEKIGEAE